MKSQAQNIFRQIFGPDPVLISFSPGRVNIIGEHTDYNEGFVLPAAIDLGIAVAIGPSATGRYEMYASFTDTRVSISTSDIALHKEGWPNYVLGMIDQFRKAGMEVPACNISITSNLPVGSGLSSSAALECAVGYAFQQWQQWEIAPLQLAKMARQAEHTYAGVLCGIMDMFASVMGRAEQVVKLDCRDYSYEYFPLQTPGFSWILLNTNVKHTLASSAYNKRRQQCKQAVEAVNAQNCFGPAYKFASSLRDISRDQLDNARGSMSPQEYQRASFVLAENERVAEACKAMVQQDTLRLGKLLFESHQGLSSQYEVSCAELDFLVEEGRTLPGLAGARMMGGGFGGCTLNLVQTETLNSFINTLSIRYTNQFQLPLTPIPVTVSAGTRLL